MTLGLPHSQARVVCLEVYMKQRETIGTTTGRGIRSKFASNSRLVLNRLDTMTPCRGCFFDRSIL